MDLNVNKKIVASPERLKMIGLKIKELVNKVKYLVFREGKVIILKMFTMLVEKYY